MDEQPYRHLVDATLKRIDDAFAEIDPDLAECNVAQGALTIVFPGAVRAIVSPQPPVRQMWLAFRDRAWHFDFQAPDRWIDDKTHTDDLYTLLAQITKQATGLAVTI